MLIDTFPFDGFLIHIRDFDENFPLSTNFKGTCQLIIVCKCNYINIKHNNVKSEAITNYFKKSKKVKREALCIYINIGNNKYRQVTTSRWFNPNFFFQKTLIFCD